LQVPQETWAPTFPDPAEMEAFFDGVFAAQKEALHVSAATVSVVANGRLVFAKGYGYADIEKGAKVDPEKTLFRIGSVSKLFTWTAVMQLVEQGKLDLDADLNIYLKEFQVPATYPEPITLAHLLTHTPGFEDQVIGLFARTEDRLRPLGQILAEELPDRVRPPGQLASYSNHGTALAGYIVQEVSGMPWADYIEKNILQPLGMEYTTVRQPLPETLAADMAGGYRRVRGEFKAQGFEFVPAAPAGSMSASAADMARFMIAHLQHGSFGQGRILSEETARRMHSRLFAHSPKLNGMLHGFYEMNRNGQAIFGHGGDTMWFHTQLALFPEHNVGLFVSYNSDTGGKARSDFVKVFTDRYFPAAEAQAPKPPADFQTRAARFTGSYASLRHSHTSLAKMARLMGTMKVTADPDGCLLVSGIGDAPLRLVEMEPLVFREVKDQGSVVFREDERGKITHLFLNALPPMAFVRLNPTETPVFHFVVLGISAAVLLIAVVAWPATAYRRRSRAPVSFGSRLARLIAWTASALLIAFLIALGAGLSDAQQIAFGVPSSLRLALALPLVAAPIVAVAAIVALISWFRRYWSVGSRIGYSLVTVACLIMLWWLQYWNLLGYHFD
ncbi:MAG: serine hydrolase, partial [Acidobacteria bacterium]|nr:serine hydrolase [Acidobacteriota bacterium]